MRSGHSRLFASMGLAAGSVLLLTGCIGPSPIIIVGGGDKTVEWIYQVDFSQSQAVPGFDDSDFVIDDLDSIQAFQRLLNDHDVKPWIYQPAETEGCTGGVTTALTVYYRENPTDDLVIDGCAAKDGSFEADATAFFSDYREANGVASLTNDRISSLTFSQTQALEGFDDSEYTQGFPQQVARFTELLEKDRIVWSEGVDPSLAGEACPGAIMTQITAAYADSDLVVGPVAIGGCSDVSFADAVTALFAEWRVSLAS